MVTYYKHKATRSAQVPYSFRCEHCLQDSGLLKATISGIEAEYSSPMNKLTSSQKEKLEQNALSYLKTIISSDYKNATDKQIFSTAFKDECPHCHEPQSWAISGLKDDLYITPVAILIVGVVLSLIAYFFAAPESLLIYFIIGGVSVLIATAILTWKLIKIKNKTKKTSFVVQKNLPTIDWSPVRDLIDEN